METLNLFRELYRKWKGPQGRPSRDDLAAAFRFRYACFKDLLDSNTQLLNLIADLEEKLGGRHVFGMSYVRSQSARAAFHAFRMIKSLDVLSGHRYPYLYGVLDKINAGHQGATGGKKRTPGGGPGFAAVPGQQGYGGCRGGEKRPPGRGHEPASAFPSRRASPSPPGPTNSSWPRMTWWMKSINARWSWTPRTPKPCPR